MGAGPVLVNARGMKCPWPVLRAAKAMRTADTIHIHADDPIAAAELAALSQQHGWHFADLGNHVFLLGKMVRSG